MSDNREKTEGFLSRWSRLKQQPGNQAAGPEAGLAKTASGATAGKQDAPTVPPTAVVELPPLDSLTIDSDYSAFMQPHIEESVRRVALRKLLRDPHFNVMDGLDVYIEDFGKADPIPAAMLGDQLKQLLAAQGREMIEEDAIGDAKKPEPAEIKSEPAIAGEEETGQTDAVADKKGHIV